MIRNYKEPNERLKTGKIIAQDGNVNYTVGVERQLWRRQRNHISPVKNTILEANKGDKPITPIIEQRTNTITITSMVEQPPKV